MSKVNIDNLIVGKCYMLGSTNKYLGKLINKPEIEGYRDDREKVAYFTNEKGEKTSVKRWYNFDWNNSNQNIENIFIETTEKFENIFCNCGLSFKEH
jgi:hypothetical protein